MAKKANVEKYSAVIAKSNAVHEQYKQYVDTYVHRANKELYAMLAEILRYAADVFARSDKDAVILAMRKVLKDKYNIKTTTKTGDLGVLLRMVLRNAHRKTICVYKRVLQQAMNNGVDADNLAVYIEQNGGIDKLREGTAEQNTAKRNAMTAMDEQILGSYYLLACEEMRKLGSMEINEDVYLRYADARNNDGIAFIACTHNNGKLDMLEFVEINAELNEKLLRKLYKDGFDKVRLDDGRRALAKRASELNEMQAVMLGDKIYSNGKEVEDIKEEEFVT